MKVSVITPSYNQGKFIERTLKSVKSQIAANFEIEHFVFDGASEDNTIEILKECESLVRWKSEKDGGQTNAVNKGIRSSDGEIIGWLNSDDVYYPGAISRVVAFFESNPDVDVVYGMADHINLEDIAFEPYPTEPYDYERLKEICFICQPATFFRRRVVNIHGLLDESLNYCMDYEYWLRLSKAGVRFAYLQEPLAGSRLYADNKTIGARVKVHREINDMLQKIYATVPDRWLSNYAHAVVNQKINLNDNPKLFILILSLVVFFSSLYWNRCVSLAMLKQIKQWLKRR